MSKSYAQMVTECVNRANKLGIRLKPRTDFVLEDNEVYIDGMPYTEWFAAMEMD